MFSVVICILSYNRGFIINSMYRQSSNSKKIFYRGITLKDYLRKSQVLITQDQRDETLLVDEYNNPLIKFENLVFWKNQVPLKLKFDTQDFSTKVSKTKCIDSILPPLQNQKSMINPQINNVFGLNCYGLSYIGRKESKATQLPPFEIPKSQNMKLQNFKDQAIKKRLIPRLKCMASREVSEQSEDQLQTFKRPQQKILTNREYIEQVKKDIKQRRHYSFQKKEVKASRLKSVAIQNSMLAQEE